MKRALRVSLVALLAPAAIGCALLGKNEAMVPRFFTLEPPARQTTTTTTTTAATIGASEPSSAPELRLGRVTAAANIGDAIVYRLSDREVGFYDNRLWSEKPDAYLERALARVLFEEKGLRRLVAGAGPVLDVSLEALEEVLGRTPRARVQLSVVLSDDKNVLFERTFVVERPIVTRERGGVESVGALADALETAVEQVADRVTTELRRRPAAPCDPGSAHGP